MDRLEITAVKSGSGIQVLLKVIDSGEKNLLAAFRRSENVGTIVLVLPFTDEEKFLREILTCEVHSTDLIISLHTKILHQMGEDNRTLIIRRDRVIVQIGLDVLVAVLELDVVRGDKLGVKPLVKIILSFY